MSESQISKRLPDPSVRVSTTDNHRLLTNQPEPQRPRAQPPRGPALADTAKGRARPVAAPPPPSGVTIGQTATVFSTVSKGSKVSTPPRPTPAHVANAAAHPAREAAAEAVTEARGFPLVRLDDSELALVGSLVSSFAATAGGEGLALAQRVIAKLRGEVEERDRDASEPEALPPAPGA